MVFNISFTEPAAISEAVGVYVAVRLLLSGVYLPRPPLHTPVFPEPFNCIGKFVVHTVIVSLGPALIGGAGENDSFMVSLTELHVPFPVLVMASCIEPAAKSDAEG